jgi:hypothetical protein
MALLVCACLASPASAATKTVWAVGDGADSGTHDDAIASMIEQHHPDAFLYLGDVYDSGTANEYATYYEPGYGRLRSITRPTPGNHEWDRRAEGYDPYWGSSFTAPHYYSFDLGGWHLISLNSEEARNDGSAQLAWLRADVSERYGNCTIGFWHRPRYSAGPHGDDSELAPLWGALAGRASIVLTGHDHNYQRLRPIEGITDWVVGTGGHGHTGANASDSRLAAINATDYGALRLSLTDTRAYYQFVAEDGGVLDSGTVACDPTLPPSRVDTRAPRITRLAVNRKLFLEGARSPRRVAFRYRLSERADVTVSIRRVSPGGTVTLRKLRQAGRKGLNRKLYSGTVAGRSLRPALYRAVLEATDRGGNVSKPKTVSFRVKRR